MTAKPVKAAKVSAAEKIAGKKARLDQELSYLNAIESAKTAYSNFKASQRKPKAAK